MTKSGQAASADSPGEDLHRRPLTVGEVVGGNQSARRVHRVLGAQPRQRDAAAPTTHAGAAQQARAARSVQAASRAA